MDWLLRETRVALRSLARSPAFSLISGATLGLGIALPTAMFSVVYALLLQRLPYREPGRLVALSAMFDETAVPFSVSEYLDLRERARSFSELAATRLVSGNLTGGDRPERLDAQAVTGGFFAMLRARAALGRVFVPGDETPGVTPIGIVSHRLWRQRFGGDPGVIGRTVELDQDEYTIVGVAPPEFEHPGASGARPVDFWLPSGFRAEPFPVPRRDLRLVQLYGRLAPGVGLAQARDELRRLLEEFRSEHPNDYPGSHRLELRVDPLHESLAGHLRRPLFLLLAATGLVLVIACVNVAGLRLARQTTRAPELAVRRAFGGSTGRLAGAVLIEGLLLALAGGAAGVALTYGGTAVARNLLPETLARTHSIAVNPAVLAFAVAAVVTTALACSVAPVVVISRMDPAGGLRGGTRGIAGGGWGARVRSSSVIAEISLSLLLLGCAGVLFRGLWRLQQVDPGFATGGLLTLQLEISYPNDTTRGRYLPTPARREYFTELLRRLREVPGVDDAAFTSELPLEGEFREGSFSAEGADAGRGAETGRAHALSVSDGYFRVMGIPILQGRELTRHDDARAPAVVVVSEGFARRAWPGKDALGRRIKPGPFDSPAPWYTVVGVVPDVRSRRLEEAPGLQVYSSYLTDTPTAIRLAARTRADPAALTRAVRAAVESVDRDQPVFAVRTMEEIVEAQLASRRLATMSLGLFAALAAILAGIGLYGMLAYSVAQRRREFGVRMALGATPGIIVADVCRDGLRLAAAGVGIGLVSTLALERVLASLIARAEPNNVATLLLTTGTMLAIALAACLFPARRAAAVNPHVALKGE